MDKIYFAFFYFHFYFFYFVLTFLNSKWQKVGNFVESADLSFSDQFMAPMQV